MSPNAPMFACPCCRNPDSRITLLQDAVVITPVRRFVASRFGEPHAEFDHPTEIDYETPHNPRYECNCGCQFNQPIDVSAPAPEPDDAPARVDDSARRT